MPLLSVILMLMLVMLSGGLDAAPYGSEGTITEWVQPDGSKLGLRVFGDEFHARTETMDGYTVIFDPRLKAYVYARLSADGNELLPVDWIVGQGDPATHGRKIEKHLRIRPESAAKKARERYLKWDEATQTSKRWREKKESRRAVKEAAKKDGVKKDGVAAPDGPAAAAAEGDGTTATEVDSPSYAPPGTATVGNKVGLTLLIDFTDDPATIPQASIIDFVNGDSYTGYGNNGSVKKYFQDNSNGLLTYTNTVTAYIRMAQPKTYYNNTSIDCGTQGNLLILDALAIMKALPNYATEILPAFANLSTDAGGSVLACNVYYAGGNGGVWSYGLWPHSWSIYATGDKTLGNGMSLSRYQVTNIGSSLELGTFCHENGHMLCGYPDIYDYGYDSAGGAGGFCLMNSGGHGTNPVQINAYLKEASGWATLVELGASSGLTASVSSSGADFNKLYRYQKPGVATEYYLVENRQKSGRDANIAASGIAIWHIDELGNKDNQSMVYNTTHANYECTLMQADGLWHFQNNVNSGDSKDLYYLGNAAAGYTNAFNDSTPVSARWWDGTNSNIDFNAFSSSGTTMTFQVSPTAAYALTVSPESAFQAAGPQGGPFTPLETEYTVTNNSSDPVEWSVATTPATHWLTISPTSGTLAGKTSLTVTVSINANADSLVPGTYNPQLVFSNVTGGSTLNRSVSLVVRPMAGFAWDTISSPRYRQSPFSVNLRAVDSTGALFKPFNGTATLAGISGASGQTVTVGAGTSTWTYPFSAASHDARTQTIYLKSEIGAAQQFTGLALNVAVTPGQTLSNFTIRLQHTTTSKYNNDNGAVWLASGWSTLYQGDVTISQTGWIEFPFTAPFSYDGTNNLMVDFSFNNTSGSSDGAVFMTPVADNRSIVLTSNSANGDPLTWSGRTPAGTRSANIANIKLLAPGAVTISPTVTGNFVNGVWSGLVTVNEVSASLFLRATNATLTGDSNAFAVEAKTIPDVTEWPIASAIAYGQAVGASILSGGSASVAGGFSFTNPTATPPSGTISVPVIFTPTDTANYGPVEGMVSLMVNQSTPSVSAWPTATSIVYGQTLSASSLSGGSASVAGSFSFVAPATNPPLGDYTAAVCFTPTDANNYNVVDGTVVVSVGQATPTVTAWPTASAIVFGQALADSSLSGGTASVAGTFAFAVPSTTPGTGTYSADMVFTPTDTTNYNTVGGNLNVIVVKAPPVVHAWPTASAIAYGQVVADSTLTGGSASVPGVFVFSEGGAGFTGSDSFTFKVNDGTVDSAPATVALTVATVGSSAPASTREAPQAAEPIETTVDHITDIHITCDNGYELYLNGVLLGSGSNWNSAGRYQNAALQVGRNVVAIKGIDAGGVAAMLAEIVLDGQRIGSSASWKVSLTPPTDWKDPVCDDSTWPSATDYGAYGISPWGTGVAGMPADTPAKWIWSSNSDLDDAVYFRYVIDVIPPNTSPIANAQDVAVERNTPQAITLTGSDPDSDPLTYETVTPPTYGALSGTPPNVTYTPPSMFDPGFHNVTVVFIPTDETNYQTVSDTVELEVLPGTNVVVSEWPMASGIVYGQPLSESTLTGGMAPVEGGFAFSGPATVLNAGTHSVAVTFTPSDTETYNPVQGSVTVAVAKATPVITAWPFASDIDDGQYFSASILSGGTALVSGHFVFNDPAALFMGEDAFTFRVSDSALVSEAATVSLTIGTPAAAPTPSLFAAEAPATATSLRADGYTVVTFTEGSGTWTVPHGVTSVELLVIGGGGGGGASTNYSGAGAGGGGAGGLIHIPEYAVTGGGQFQYAVGSGSGGGTGGNVPGIKGVNSTFGVLTALGGGGGSGGNMVGLTGGSGGGSRIASLVGGAGTQPTQPDLSGQYGHGKNGGAIGDSAGSAAGGGGGAGAAGVGTAGGAGKSVSITGTAMTYAGGGGGGASTTSTPGLGGAGGGGNGGNNGTVPTAGTPNTGGGGGGGNNAQSGARGGDGILVLAYVVNNQPPVADAQSVSMVPNTPTAIALTGSDPDNDPLTFEIVTQPTFGTLSGTAPNITYTPPPVPEPGVYPVTIVFTPADTANYQTVSGSANLRVLANSTPYEQWSAQFTGQDLSDLLADNDGDGLKNLMEYAFGLNPTAQSTGVIRHADGVIITLGTPTTSMTQIIDDIDFCAVFGRRKDYLAAGLVYQVQFSADLATWVTSADTPTVVATDTEVEAVTVPYPSSIDTGQGTAKPKFFRVGVSMP